MGVVEVFAMNEIICFALNNGDGGQKSVPVNPTQPINAAVV